MQTRPSSRQSSSQAHGCRTQQRWPNLRRDKAIRLGQTTLEIVLFPPERKFPAEKVRERCNFFGSLPIFYFTRAAGQDKRSHRKGEKKNESRQLPTATIGQQPVVYLQN